MPRNSSPLVAALSVALVGLGVLTWQQHGEIARLRAALRQKPDGVVSAAAASNRAIGTTISRVTSVPLARPNADVATPGPDDEFVPRAAPAAKPARRATGVARLMSDPEFVRAFALHQEGALDARFAALFRQLNLSAEELANFKHLLVEKESVALDVVAISQESPGGPLPAAELNASISAAQSQVENAILASLGRDRYAVYQEFERTIAQRAVVARLEQRLSYTPTPLAPAQAEAVVRILSREVPAESTARPAIAILVGGGVTEGAPIARGTPSAARVNEEQLAQTQAVLSPPQVAALRQVQMEIGATEQAAKIFSTFMPEIPTGDEAIPALRTLTQ